MALATTIYGQTQNALATVVGSGAAANIADAIGAAAQIALSVTAVGNVTTGEDNLISVTLPANWLNCDCKAISVKAWGTTANNGDAKTLKLYFGSAVILTNSLTVSVAGKWTVEAIIVRTAANAQDVFAELRETGNDDSDIEIGTATQTDTADITIKLTGEATSTNDIVNEGLLVRPLN